MHRNKTYPHNWVVVKEDDNKQDNLGFGFWNLVDFMSCSNEEFSLPNINRASNGYLRSANIMNQEYLSLVLKLEFHGLSHDTEAISSCPHINSGVCILEEWLPKYEWNSKISFHIKDYKVH